MNRWFGDKTKSDQQASERSQRAARRTIAGLPPLVLSSDDEDAPFNDCETSFHLNVDGTADEALTDEPTPGTSSWSLNQPSGPPPATMAPAVAFDVEDKGTMPTPGRKRSKSNSTETT